MKRLRGFYVSFDEDGDECHTADTVVEEDQVEKHFTGLYTERGDPIYRVVERVPLGFDIGSKDG